MNEATALNVEAASDMGKINLVTYPPLPGNCAICLAGTDGHRQFIDFQLSYDFEGAVVICVACWRPVADKLGYVSPEQVFQLNEQLVNLHGRVKELQIENESINRALDSMFAVRPNLSRNDSSVNDAHREDVESRAQDSLFDDAGLDQPIEFGKSKSTDSDSKWGPENVSKPDFKL